MKVAIVGLGLIGGSIALDLKKSGFAHHVIGVDHSPDFCAEALELKLVEEIMSLEKACAESDLVVLATPVNVIAHLLPKVLSLLSDAGTVTDVGSTKSEIGRWVDSHPQRNKFVAAHPMAGTEFSGPKAAHEGLFQGKASVICDRAKSDPLRVKLVEEMYQALKMRLIFMESKEHDLHTAYVSHLSHISSFVLANTVLDKEKDVETIFNLASGGFESTVRLAKSSPEMWTPIFEQNQAFITEALGEYIDRLKLFQENLIQQQFQKTTQDMQRANEIKRVLHQIGAKNVKKS